MRILLNILLLFICYSCISQENDSLRVRIKSSVKEPDYINPNTRIETYIDINDSLDFFIDNIQKIFGETEEVNGLFEWKDVLIDSIKGKLIIVMANGLWYDKNNQSIFEVRPVEKTLKLKKSEKRGLRMRFFLSDGKDALLSHKNQLIIISILESALNKRTEEEITE